jgi:hypothetical protein
VNNSAKKNICFLYIPQLLTARILNAKYFGTLVISTECTRTPGGKTTDLERARNVRGVNSITSNWNKKWNLIEANNPYNDWEYKIQPKETYRVYFRESTVGNWSLSN